MESKKTKPTKIPRATEKRRRFDAAIRYLHDEARGFVEAADRHPKLRTMYMLDAAAASRAAEMLEDARD